MQLKRLFRHLILPHWWVLRAFPPQTPAPRRGGRRASESVHGGELRVVVEANLPLPDLLQGRSTRARAIELFSQLRSGTPSTTAACSFTCN
jgi:hypothetical protein